MENLPHNFIDDEKNREDDGFDKWLDTAEAEATGN